MVFREYFILLLLAHIIGDFYIQSSNMDKRKVESIKWLLIHCLCYWTTIMIVSLPVMSWEIAAFGTAVSIVHVVIDASQYVYISKLKKNKKLTMIKERDVFLADQALHLVTLTIAAYLFVLKVGKLNLFATVDEFFAVLEISKVSFLCWITAILIIHKPTNIAISKLLIIYKPKDNDDGIKKDKNAGRFIGTVERILILIFISIKQYSAIGLVLTAKSIARYDRISKEKDFAEYYLLGTLISTVVVIVVSFIM
jgi:hypothetical protein